MDYLICILLVGLGATAVIDIWAIIRKRLLGTPPPNYGLVGRWFGHMLRGRFQHDAIAKAAPVSGERVIGWSAHYLIGIAFAAILFSIWGFDWIYQPTLMPALIVGLGSVTAPFLIMQPGMGAGIAASRTSRPSAARIQSLVTHVMFGLGLYTTGWGVNVLYIS